MRLTMLPLAVLLALGAPQSGCVSAAPAIAAGATAASAGVSILSYGKYASYEMVRFDDAVDATRRAADALHLQLRHEIPDHRNRWIRLIYRDDLGQDLNVKIERRSETVSGILVDVGRFGRAGMGALLQQQILDELAEAGAYLETWSRTNPRAGGAGAGTQ